jgi:phosphate starvation-inducible PhoH-like protein
MTREDYELASIEEEIERKLEIERNEEAQELFGRHDSHLKHIERSFAAKIVTRGNQIVITGKRDEVDKVAALLSSLLSIVRQSGSLAEQEVRYGIDLTKDGEVARMEEVLNGPIITTARGKQVRPRGLGQKAYVEAMRRRSLVFCIGPAGTGKTYLAVAMAVAALSDREFSRIVLTRPAVEAGEKLGFLPGDIQEKVNPYLRPIYDALFDLLGVDTFEKYMSRGILEVAPLAYMRGRTLDDSFIILDEAQNTTPEQMKMFLTRMGIGSKAVVTGDITQIDLPRGTYSGLEQVRIVLKEVEGLEFVYLTEKDVVRHELVQRIVQAYERFNRKAPQERPGEER